MLCIRGPGFKQWSSLQCELVADFVCHLVPSRYLTVFIELQSFLLKREDTETLKTDVCIFHEPFLLGSPLLISDTGVKFPQLWVVLLWDFHHLFDWSLFDGREKSLKIGFMLVVSVLFYCLVFVCGSILLTKFSVILLEYMPIFYNHHLQFICF